MLLTVGIAVHGRDCLLHECIGSVRGIADEILVCHPASLGAVRAVSESGARCLPFDDDPRLDWDAILNRALDEAGGEWVLYLEAHERLDTRGRDLRVELSRTGSDAFALQVRRLGYRLVPGHRSVAPEHPCSHGAVGAVDRRAVRLFRRRSGHRFGGRLDPCVEPALHRHGATVADGPWFVLEHPLLLPVSPHRAQARAERARALVAHRPEDPDTWLDLGRFLLAETPSPASARECFLAAWRIRPEAGAGMETARALAGERRFEEAIAALDAALVSESATDGRYDDADIWELRGEMLRSLERSEEAERDYRRAIALAPDRPGARIGLVELLCGNERHEEAAPHARWLRRRYPGLGQSWIAGSLVDLSRGHVLSAIEALKVALDIDPASAIARYDLAIAYARLGAHRAARSALRQARALRGGIALAGNLATVPDAVRLPTLEPLGPEGVVSFIPALAGGAGRVAVDIVRCLASDHPQAVITHDCSDQGGIGFLDELAALGVPVVSVGSGNQLATVRRVLDPAVLLFHAGAPEVPPFVGAGPVMVSVSHGGDPFISSHHDHYVCLSHAHRRNHGYLPEARVRIIPNGVDVDRFRRARPDPRPWGGEPDGSAVRIAMLSRLDPTKCVRRLLHLLEPLHDLDVRISIAGRGARRWEIEPELARFAVGAKVRFAGPVPSRAVPSYLAAADIGLHLTETHHETLSIAILEMLAAGLPVVSQPRGCLPELVSHGVNGFLFEDEAQIGAALRRLVLSEALRARMGAASRERAKCYGLAAFDDAWRGFVRTCVEEHRRRRRARSRRRDLGTSTPERGAAALMTALRPGGPEGPRPCYFVATDRRTGGTLLCTALHATGVAGYPREDLAHWTEGLRGRSWRYPTLDEYLLAQWQQSASPRGVYGLRLMFDHFTALCAAHGSPDWPRRWLQRVRSPLWIFLRRRDRLAQAISLYRAERTGLWCDAGEPKIGVAPVPYDRAAIEDCRERLEGSDRAWRAFFAEYELRPLEIFYEDLAVDLEGQVRAILDRLGVEPPDPFVCRSAMHRQADDQTSAWMARFTGGE